MLWYRACEILKYLRKIEDEGVGEEETHRWFDQSEPVEKLA